jgi:hypothetical protein
LEAIKNDVFFEKVSATLFGYSHRLRSPLVLVKEVSSKLKEANAFNWYETFQGLLGSSGWWTVGHFVP